jgi:hypothetical protein
MNKEELRAKARFLRPYNNPGLKSGVIDNELIVDFSPKPVFFRIITKFSLIKNSMILFVIPDTHIK